MQIPYGRQNIQKRDINAVLRVLNSDFLTQGPTVPKFEQRVSELTGATYSYAVNSATSALHVACLALDVGVNDIVWTTPNSFVATANCALYCGAQIDFVDIDPITLNLSIDALQKKLELSKLEGKLPKVVIIVHFAGASGEMKLLKDLSQKYGFAVIEDASHAIGAKYNECHVGSCKYSDITVFSFHPVKIITTGEGGMLTTNCKSLGKRINLFRNHGITRSPTEFVTHPDGAWFYEQQLLGFNYRMTDIQAALGISQLERLNQFLEHRKAIASRYESLIENLPILYQERNIKNSAHHLFVVQLKDATKRKSVFNYMRKRGIGVNVHYIPIYRQPFYKQMDYNIDSFPNAEFYYDRCLSLPIFFDMTFDQQDYVVESLYLAINEDKR